MTQAQIESAFRTLEESVLLLQKELMGSYFDSLIETLDNLNEENQVRVEAGVPKAEVVQQLEMNYQAVAQLQLEPEEKRKVVQLLILQGIQKEGLQPNHQLTPDSLGYLFVYIIEQFVSENETTQILDLTVGTGNLLYTLLLNLRLAKREVVGIGVDVDDTLLALAAATGAYVGETPKLYHQDGLQDLLVDPVDFAVADLPIGYYPQDEQAKKFQVHSDEGHTYAHHLLMEQSMKYVKPGGYGLFLLPSNFMETEQSGLLTAWLKEHVYLQAILALPASMFQSKQLQKSIVLVQNKGEDSKQATEVFAANLPSLKEVSVVQHFFKAFAEWKKVNL